MQKYLLAVSTIVGLVVCPTPTRAQYDTFTVKDSIQMAHFNDPIGRPFQPPVWNISPDGSMALLVTTRGAIVSNAVESTVWTLDLRGTASYLEENDHRTPPSPKEIITVKGQLRAPQTDSYGSLITKCQWSLNSKAIYMLVEQENGRRELDTVDLVTGRRQRLSGKGYNVGVYEVDRRGVLYSADQFQDAERQPAAKGLDVIDSVRGTPLAELLWPSMRPKRFLFRSDSSGIRSIAVAPQLGLDSFSISPDGSKVITLAPVESTPDKWKRYLPGLAISSLYKSEPGGLNPVLEYEVVDLRTNSTRPLLGSPSGFLEGYADRPQEVWSPRGGHVLVTNTFLPLDHQTSKEQEARRRPCTAAYVDVARSSGTCIVFTRSAKDGDSADIWMISDIKFGQTEHNVVIKLLWYGRSTTECYSSTGGIWSEDPKNACDFGVGTPQGANGAPVLLELKQGLNEPPSLWAEDVKTHRRAQIWDPNPQIAGKLSAKASVYHWLDKDKREWTGGLILPQGYKPGTRYPLVIQTHGFLSNEFFAEGQWATANAARAMASVGFVVLQAPDTREERLTPEEAKIHTTGYLAAIDQLAESGIVDPKRVGIIGFSRTCWYVEESLLDYPDRFAAAVLADGIDASYLQYMISAEDGTGMEFDHLNGVKPFGKELDAYIKSAPDFRLSELETPLRLQAIGPLSLLAEWEIYSSLKVQDKPVDMTYFPLGQHILQNPAERMASGQGDVDWFRFWLKGEEDSDPAKKRQYERWGSLRKRRVEESTTGK